MLDNKSHIDRICKAIIANKPKMVKGKAVYLGQSYTSLDDAWDWFEDDLDAVRFGLSEYYDMIETI